MGKIEGRRFLSERPALCSVPPARSTHRMEIEALSCPLGEKLGVERGCSPRTGSGQDRKKQKNARGSEKNGTGQSHGRVSPFFPKVAVSVKLSSRANAVCHPERTRGISGLRHSEAKTRSLLPAGCFAIPSVVRDDRHMRSRNIPGGEGSGLSLSSRADARDLGFYFLRLQNTGTRGRSSRSPEAPASPPKEHPPPEEETEVKAFRQTLEFP